MASSRLLLPNSGGICDKIGGLGVSATSGGAVAGALAVAGIAAVLCGARTAETPGTLEAGRFVLVGSRGTPLAAPGGWSSGRIAKARSPGWKGTRRRNA